MDGNNTIRRLTSIGHTGPVSRALYVLPLYRWDTGATDPGMVSDRVDADLT
jgi:hypothetical protein